MSTSRYEPLSQEQIDTLLSNGCAAEDWSRVAVTGDFDPRRVVRVRFDGDVRLGNFDGMTACAGGLTKPAGLYDAYLADCTIGDRTRIANIGVHIANYDIEEDVLIEDVGLMQTRPDAQFGSGVEVEALNEAGGREVTLFNGLSAQFAYLQCLARGRPRTSVALEKIANREVSAARGHRGKIGRGATVASVSRIEDVHVGQYAEVAGAASLVNGAILSCQEAPTKIGAGVVAEDFIVAEGAQVTGGAIVCKSFVGQACQIGKQFSAEGSLFFANCEGFHGEACSIFAGPYTVTHHKSTLLIAGLFSFYNAGSGTNQSNHMYKLGPVHEGKLERGCKTGSFSYIMWPCRVGPFSVVLGKHTRTFDTRDFPFSHIEAKADGRCEMVPGLYLSTVGTLRDGQKWPTRDRRTAPDRRDLIHFQVFSPLTVGRMLHGHERLKKLMESTPKAVKNVTIEGAEVRRVLLRTGVKHYQTGIEMYLQERLIARIEQARRDGQTDLGAALVVSGEAVLSDEWVDVAGMLTPLARWERLLDRLEAGEIDSLAGLRAALAEMHAAYEEDEWAWVVWAYRRYFDKELVAMTTEGIKEAAQSWRDLRTKFLKRILNDAGKEFEAAARTGFGVGGAPEEVVADFQAVRGTFQENSFVQQVERELAEVAERAEAI